MFAALLVAAMAAALLVPSAGSATSGVAGCDTGTPAGPNLTTYECNIPTGTIGGYEVRQWYALAPTPPENGFITHMETDIVDEGTGAQVPISRLMLHHIVFLDVNRQDSTCAGQGYMGFDGRKEFGNTFAPAALLRRRRRAGQDVDACLAMGIRPISRIRGRWWRWS